MRAAERRALLGDDVIAEIGELVSTVPAPSPDLVGDLRRILTHPATPVRLDAKPRPAHRAA